MVDQVLRSKGQFQDRIESPQMRRPFRQIIRGLENLVNQSVDGLSVLGCGNVR